MRTLMGIGPVAMVAALAAPCGAQSLIGKPMQVSRRTELTVGSRGVDSDTFIVGSGVELANFGAFPVYPGLAFPGIVDVDVSATTILLTATRYWPFSQSEVLTIYLNAIPPMFRGVTVNPATDWAGFTGSRAFASGTQLTVNLSSLRVLQGQKIVLDLNMVNVPEPSGAALGGLALAGLGAVRRRRARVTLGAAGLR